MSQQSQSPIVSVLVPLYNAAPYIDECLDSILACRDIDIEVVVVDDGSTDSSAERADAIARRDSRVTVVRASHQGMSATRNRALDAARGEYVMMVDSDDMLHPRAIERLLAVARATGADVVAARLQRGDRPRWRPVGTAVKVLTHLQAIGSTLYQSHGMNPSSCAKLFKRSIFDHERYTPGIYYEDLDIITRIYLRCERVARIPDELYYYRSTPGSIINTFRERRLDVLKVVDDTERLIHQRCPRLAGAARDRKFSANYNMFILLTLHGRAAQAEACWQVLRQYRLKVAADPRSRFKNRVGALLTLMGRRPVMALAKRLGYK